MFLVWEHPSKMLPGPAACPVDKTVETVENPQKPWDNLVKPSQKPSPPPAVPPAEDLCPFCIAFSKKICYAVIINRKGGCL